VFSNVAASTISESRQGAETTSTAVSHGKLPKQMNKEKDATSRRSAVRRPSQDIAKDSVVLAGELIDCGFNPASRSLYTLSLLCCLLLPLCCDFLEVTLIDVLKMYRAASYFSAT